MESTTLRTIHRVNTMEALRGFSRAGFLDYVGEDGRTGSKDAPVRLSSICGRPAGVYGQ